MGWPKIVQGPRKQTEVHGLSLSCQKRLPSHDGGALDWVGTERATAIRFATPWSVAGRPHGRRRGAPARRRPRVTTNPAAAAGPLMPDSPQLHHSPPPPAPPPPPPPASSTPAASAAANAQPTLVLQALIISSSPLLFRGGKNRIFAEVAACIVPLSIFIFHP